MAEIMRTYIRQQMFLKFNAFVDRLEWSKENTYGNFFHYRKLNILQISPTNSNI